MSSVNKVIIVGNLVRDPETKSFQSGGSIAEITVATSERWTDKATGEKKEKSEFHRVIIRNDNLVRFAENSLKKGAKVYVEGQLQTREWLDQAGVKKYATEIMVGKFKGEVVLLSGGKDREPRQDAQKDTGRKSFADDLEDDIPFE
jgi:single-strand DNA-binding protein